MRVLMKESNRVDSDYTCSWYMRYRQTATLGEDGSQVIIASKPVVTCKDNLVDLSTSFNHGTSGDGEDVWGDGECGGGIFAGMFS